MTRRIAVWALAGAMVAAGWGLFSFLPVARSFNLGQSNLVALTVPIAFLGRSRNLAISLYGTLVLNALTYAWIGLFVELIRRGRRASRMRLQSR